LDNPDSQIGKAIRTEIDNITALLCKSIGEKGDACNADSIKTLTGKL
jgi:hypothetical protein